MKGFMSKLKLGRDSLAIMSILVLTVNGGVVHAAETGGYPWADATLIRASTYDWGYTDCQPAMVQAKTCSAHYGYKDGVAYHESDPWKYDVRNCTSFVAWRVNQSFQINLRGFGDAKNWVVSAQRAGYATSKQPRPGDIAVWTNGTYGHVAYVTAVNADNSVNVEQYNKGGRGEFSRQSRVRADMYIHVAPTVTPKPAIDVPVLSQTTINSVTTSVPVATVPVAKAPVQVIPPQPVVVTQPVQTPEAPVVAVPDETSYFVESNAKEGIRTYAIKHKNTKSGKVEISKSESAKETSVWSTEVVTTETTTTNEEVTYTLGDYNADGVSDMYRIAHNKTSSGKVEVGVLDGSNKYASYLKKWTTTEPTHPASDVWYAVADQNGDGSLDLYQVWHDHTASQLAEIKVLDGVDFAKTLFASSAPEPNHSAGDVYFMIGDHNNDGIVDLYQVLHNNTASGRTEVRVYDGSGDHAVLLSKWTTDQTNYSGNGPNI